MAANLLTSTQPSPDLGLDPTLLKVTSSSKASQVGEPRGKLKKLDETAAAKWNRDVRNVFLETLPATVLSFERTPWDQLMPKVRDA
jgi:hypothetical protein